MGMQKKEDTKHQETESPSSADDTKTKDATSKKDEPLVFKKKRKKRSSRKPLDIEVTPTENDDVEIPKKISKNTKTQGIVAKPESAMDARSDFHDDSLGLKTFATSKHKSLLQLEKEKFIQQKLTEKFGEDST